jgi:hypothetical protein
MSSDLAVGYSLFIIRSKSASSLSSLTRVQDYASKQLFITADCQAQLTSHGIKYNLQIRKRTSET